MIEGGERDLLFAQIMLIADAYCAKPLDYVNGFLEFERDLRFIP